MILTQPAVQFCRKRPLAILSGLLFCFCLVCDALIARVSPINSDMVQNYNELSAIWAGNFSLRGWALATNNYYLTDLPFYVLGRFCMGNHPALIYIVPAFVFALQLLAYVLIVRTAGTTPARRDLATLMVLILLGLPFTPAQSELHQSSVHGATITLALYGIWLVQLWLLRRRGGRLLLIPFCIIVFAAVSGDPQVNAFFAGPLVLAVFVRLWLYPGVRWRELVLAGCTIISGALGIWFIHHLTTHAGFALETNYSLGFVKSIMSLRSNIHAILRAMQMAFTARASTISSFHLYRVIAGTRLISLLVVLTLCLRIFWRAPAAPDEVVPQLLILGAACLCGLDMMSGMFATILFGDPDHPVYVIRYIMPAVILMSLAAAIETQSLRFDGRNIRRACTGAATLFALVYVFGALQAVLLAAHGKPSTKAAPQFVLTVWLKAHGYSYGVGDYWTAPMISALSDGKVTAEPVIAPGYKLAPFMWPSDMSQELAKRRPQFVAYTPVNIFGITPSVISATYGKPREVDQIGAYSVVILSP